MCPSEKESGSGTLFQTGVVACIRLFSSQLFLPLGSALILMDASSTGVAFERKEEREVPAFFYGRR